MTEYPREIEAIQFSLLSPEEIRKNGVIEIVSSDLNFLGRDGEGGLNDPHLGVINKGDRCKTCYLDSEKCPGHFGFINLAYPLYKQEYTKNIKLILELTCIHCNQLLFKREKLKMETNGLHLNDAYTRLKAMLPAGTAIKICPHCNTVQPKIKTNTMLSIEYTYSHIRNADYTKNNINAVLPNGLDERVLTEFIVYPHNDVYKRLCTLSNDTIGILRMNARYARPEWMMWTVLPVAPPVVRPNTQNDGQHSYDDWTHCYMDIINTNNKLKNLAESGKETTELINALNISVAASIFNSINPLVHKQTRKPLTGAKARLDGKEGMFRKNLIAKRVNYGCRSVVSAGPHTRIYRLGVPKKIAMILSTPVTATKYNLEILQQAVLNGPYIHPGANYIMSNGNTRNLKIGNRQDIVVKIGDKVGLHIRKGTGILFNRQPSLWRVSMLCHEAEIVPDNTFRLNLSACQPYNADFDGDEMNGHLPQSEATMAECKALMMVHKHMISSQTSTVMTGIVQDSLTGSALFSHGHIKFNQLLAAELAIFGDKFDAIDLRSKKVWTSRDIISLILPKINLNTYSKVKEIDYYGDTDKKVSIINGQHMSGIIDKQTVGPGAQNSIIHIIWRDYGPKAAADFISHLQEITAHFLIAHGFSISVGDMVVSEESKALAKQEVINEFARVTELVRKIDNGQFVTPVDVTTEEWFEQQVFMMLGSPLTEKAGKYTYSEINKRDNAFAFMIRHGSNGVVDNIYHVTAVIGQQHIVGKRAAPSYGRRTLPFYQRSEMDPISKGYAFNSYLEGYTFIEAFFISQCGREGITSTAINTASAGYLARRMTKMNERIIISYDHAARSGKEIIQQIYPFDAWYMEFQILEHIKIDYATFDRIYKHDSTKGYSAATKGLLDKEYAKLREDRKAIQKVSGNTTINNKFAFPVNIRRIILSTIADEKNNTREKFKNDDKTIAYIIEKINALCNDLPKIFVNPGVTTVPKRFIEVSEMTCVLIRSILSTKRIIEEYTLSKSSLNNAINEIKRQFSTAIIAPKEMVGYISAQSISQIATQITIDAFHNVGVSAGGKKERDQSFSRFLEILNYKRDIAKPLMIIPLAKEYVTSKDAAVLLKNKIEHIPLRAFLKKTEIIYDPDPVHPVTFDKAMVKSYFAYTPKERDRVPGNLSSYMIRMTLNRQKVYHKQIDMLTFKLKLESFSNILYAIISDINAEELIIRVHINIDNIKDFSVAYELRHVEKILDFIIHDLYVRGIKGLANINVVENIVEYENESGVIEQRKEYQLETDGNNVYGVAGLMEESIDKTRLETNEIAMIYKKYGIEAARKVMIKEAIDILRSTESDMSYMHTRLLIDNMTYGGFIMPLNRHGFKRRNPGPLIRIAFEQNTIQITRAALYAEIDELKHSPTGGIIFGQILPCGTGSMVDIYMDEAKVGISDNILDELF